MNPEVMVGDAVAPQADPWGDGGMPVKAAAAFIGVSRTGVYRLFSTGELSYTFVRGTRLVPRRQCIDLLRARAVNTAQPAA